MWPRALAIGGGLALTFAGCWLTRSFDDLAAGSDSDAASDATGSGDAASDRAGSGDAATSGLGCQGTILCDDFEHDGGFDLSIWPRPDGDQNRATLSPDRTHVHGGGWSLHVQVAPSDSGAPAEGYLVRHRNDAPFPSELYGRLFLWVPARHPEPWHPAILGFQDGEQPQGKGIVVSLFKGSLQAFEGIDSPSITQSSTMQLANDAWTCIRWHLTPTRFEAFVGQGSVLAVEPKAPFPLFVELYIGTRLDRAPVDIASDLWLDDLAVAAAPLPCE